MAYIHNKNWRLKNPEKRNAERKRYYDQFQYGNIKAFTRWTQKEDRLVLRSRLLDRDIHLKIGRSVKSIQVRRSKLKKKMIETFGI